MKGKVVWVYGPPCSGKTKILNQFQGVKLDSHAVRVRSKNWSLSAEARDTNVRTLAGVAALLSEQGVSVCIAAITPKKAQRNFIKALIPHATFLLADYDPDNLRARQVERFGDDYINEDFESPAEEE